MPIAARAKLSTRFLVLAAAALAVAGLSACDSTSGPSSTADPDTRQVTVVGTGEVQGTPDTLTANVSIEFTAPDVTTAMNQTSDRQQAVIDALVDSGIDRKDISTTNVTLQPQFGGGDNPTIIGYQASNSIDVKIRKLDSASQALALIVSTGGDATRINSVNYSIDDDSQLVKDARPRAFDDAKDRAEQYAAAVRADVWARSFRSPSRPAPHRHPADADAAERADGRPLPLEPGQQSVSFSVTVDLGADLTQPAGAISTGMPLSTAVPDSGSSRSPSLSWLTLTPGWSAATPAVCRRGRAPSRAAATRRRAACPGHRRPAPDLATGALDHRDVRRDRGRRRRRDGCAVCSGSCRPPAPARCASSCCWSADACDRSGRSRRRRGGGIPEAWRHRRKRIGREFDWPERVLRTSGTLGSSGTAAASAPLKLGTGVGGVGPADSVIDMTLPRLSPDSCAYCWARSLASLNALARASFTSCESSSIE